ncbi:MAG: GGDEF domain-containing protein [Quadrisphaera sp.]
MARLHLAGEAHHRGDAAAARTHLDEALAETRRTEPVCGRTPCSRRWLSWTPRSGAPCTARTPAPTAGRSWPRRCWCAPRRAAARSPRSWRSAARAARAADAHDAAALAVLTDPLTGVTNRRGLDEALRAAARDGTEVAACFVDVDRFKGRQRRLLPRVGDEVLRRVAALLVDVTRGHDLVARYGGDEFVVLSGHPRDLAALGQRVVDEVAALPWAQVAPGLRVSVSVGVTGPLAAHAVLASADAAMLDAKRRGRARAVVRRAS